MTLHRFTFEDRNAAGQVTRRRHVYLDRTTGQPSASTRARVIAPAPAPPPEPRPAAPEPAPIASEEITLVKEIRKDIAALQKRLDQIEQRPSDAVDQTARDHSRELAGVVADAVKRLDQKLGVLEVRLEHMQDHDARIRKIEIACERFAILTDAVAKENAAA